MLERKDFIIDEIKVDAVSGQGIISGYCSVKNVMDSGGDCVVDGAYTNLDSTLNDGFICNSHDHSEPLGYFTKVVEDAKGLYFEAQFHTTEDAMELWQMCNERYLAGKSVTFSIGYKTLDSEMGTMNGMTCRFLKSIYVKEASITLVPANDQALMLEVKTRSESFESIKQNILSYKTRLEEIHSLGRGDSWVLERKTELEDLEDCVQQVRDAINKFMPDTDLHQDVAEEKTDSDALGVKESLDLELAKAKALAVLTK